jgi:hypothetical protein
VWRFWGARDVFFLKVTVPFAQFRGRTALHIAALRNAPVIVSILLKAGVEQGIIDTVRRPQWFSVLFVFPADASVCCNLVPVARVLSVDCCRTATLLGTSRAIFQQQTSFRY